jgi:hypothetical protein
LPGSADLPAGPRQRHVTVLPAVWTPLTAAQERQAVAALAALLAAHLQRRSPTASPLPPGNPLHMREVP